MSSKRKIVNMIALEFIEEGKSLPVLNGSDNLTTQARQFSF